MHLTKISVKSAVVPQPEPLRHKEPVAQKRPLIFCGLAEQVIDVGILVKRDLREVWTKPPSLKLSLCGLKIVIEILLRRRHRSSQQASRHRESPTRQRLLEQDLAVGTGSPKKTLPTTQLVSFPFGSTDVSPTLVTMEHKMSAGSHTGTKILNEP